MGSLAAHFIDIFIVSVRKRTGDKPASESRGVGGYDQSSDWPHRRLCVDAFAASSGRAQPISSISVDLTVVALGGGQRRRHIGALLVPAGPGGRGGGRKRRY